jgi:bifunctional non-homologous end joining protein LigD
MADYEKVEVEGVELKISNPGKTFFPKLGLTKMDLVRYYLDVMPGVLTGCRDRPTLLKRHPDGVDGEFFYQKRVPKWRPEWIRTATVTFPSGRSAEFLTPADPAHVIWAVNLGCMEMHPWPVRRNDVDHSDELRIDLDPTPEASFRDVCEVAVAVKEMLAEHKLKGFPKTSGKRGMHIYIRIEPRWGFREVRRAALAVAREIEKREPMLATSAWWKEERHGVFIDYNQNARDRTIASAYSVRPTEDATVSCPLGWAEVPGADPSEFTILTVPERFKAKGDPGAGIDKKAHRIDSLLALADAQEEQGLPDAPWPPQFPKQPGEGKRVAPSRTKKASKKKSR